jgi:hypothetical protein
MTGDFSLITLKVILEGYSGCTGYRIDHKFSSQSLVWGHSSLASLPFFLSISALWRVCSMLIPFFFAWRGGLRLATIALL